LRWCAKNEHCTILETKKFVPALLRPFARSILRGLVGRQPQVQGLGRLSYDVLVAEFELRLEEPGTLLGEQKILLFQTTKRR